MLHERGRRIYNFRCYFCHGYSGDSATTAAALLTPPPRDFTRAVGLSPARIQAAVMDGRAGTAMQSFRGLLSEPDLAAVAQFVFTEFVRCGRPNTLYHIAENGWPDHRQRYGKAFPFALGELSADAPVADLSADERQGLVIFREGCITCHLAPAVGDGGVEQPDAGEHEEQEEYGEYEEYDGGQDNSDRSPPLTGLTSAEQRGETLYLQNCSYCHAADGTGRNAIGRFLEPHPPDFADPVLRQMTQDALVQAIINGKPASSMPAFKAVLGEDDAAAVAAYLRRAFMSE